jgi:hypothetical protein
MLRLAAGAVAAARSGARLVIGGSAGGRWRQRGLPPTSIWCPPSPRSFCLKCQAGSRRLACSAPSPTRLVLWPASFAGGDRRVSTRNGCPSDGRRHPRGPVRRVRFPPAVAAVRQGCRTAGRVAAGDRTMIVAACGTPSWSAGTFFWTWLCACGLLLGSPSHRSGSRRDLP